MYLIIVLLNSLQHHRMPSYSNTFRPLHILDLIKNQPWLTYFFFQDDQTITNMITSAPLGKSHQKVLRFHCTVDNNSKNKWSHYLYHRNNYGSMKLELQRVGFSVVTISLYTICLWQQIQGKKPELWTLQTTCSNYNIYVNIFLGIF